MTRSRPVPDELDFDIHVDPSCLSEPMADTDVAASTQVEEVEVGDEEKNETNNADSVEEVAKDDAAKTGAEDAEPEELEEENQSTDPTDDEDKTVPAEESSHAGGAAEDELEEADAKSEKDLSDEGPGELAATDEAGLEEPERESELEPEREAREQEALQTESDRNQSEPQPSEETEEDVPPQDSEPESKEDVASGELAEQVAEQVEETLRMAQSQSQDSPASTPSIDEPGDDEEGEEEKEVHDESVEVREASRSSSSLRRASGRTEALIQAAAKEVLERLEAQTMETIRNRSRSPRVSMDSTMDGTEIHYDGTRSEGTRRDSYDDAGSEATRRESYDTRSRASRRESDAFPTSTHTEDGGDSSSQHGADSDIFSDRSPRSSIGSFDGHIDYHKETKNRSSKRSSRISDMSMSDISRYDREEFIPTIRATQRMPFRTPSDVRALQYSSPAASVTGSPHSSKRPHLPTISRLGSPTASAQYSPKGRTTPTRFKPKKEPAPLVLLHVTLLPLRWQWAEILEAASSDTLSPEAKTLREAWHHLHDRVAETVCERGILLSHPQEDYEILEERLLEALDLPLRRRARVLECGHYIGPSNEMTLNEDTDSDEEYDDDSRRRSALVKTHWCNTCRHDIRCESLGPGKIFRIKVYASNGLMRTGAWAACWKEMERVDVEIEPIVESGVLNELERLAIAQSQKMEPQQQMELVRHDPTILESTEGRDVSDDGDMSAMSRGMHSLDRETPAFEETTMMDSLQLEEGGSSMNEPKYIEHESHVPSSTPLPAIEETCSSLSPKPKSRRDKREERRLRDEARLREIYGLSPPPHEPENEPAPEPEPHPESYMAQSPPPPPAMQQPREQSQQQEQHYHEPQHQQPPPQPDDAAAFARHQERQRAFQNAGLGELLLEAARVFMQDKKNLAMVVMGLLVLFLAVKPAQREVRDWDGKFVEQIVPEISEAPVSGPPVMETVEAVVVDESLASPEETLEMEVSVQPSLEIQVPEPSQETQIHESSQEVSSSAQATTAPAEPEESTSATTPTATEQTSFTETEAASPSDTATNNNNKIAEAPSPSAVHETITTREVVRIIETATETVKVVVTETEVVRVQASASTSVAPVISDDDDDVSVVDEEPAPPEVVVSAEVREEAAAETEQLPVEKPVAAGVVDKRDGAETTAKVEVEVEVVDAETGKRDEL